MAKHRTHSIEFKRQVVQEFLGGESPRAVSSRGPDCLAGHIGLVSRHPFSMSFAASATMTSYASRSVLSLMQAALDAVPLLAAAPGVAASIAGTLAAWC